MTYFEFVPRGIHNYDKKQRSGSYVHGVLEETDKEKVDDLRASGDLPVIEVTSED